MPDRAVFTESLPSCFQLLERRDHTSSAAMADLGDGLSRGGRGGARRSEEEEEEEDNEDDDVPGNSHPYPLHHNLLAASGLRPGKEGSARAPQGSSYPMYMRQQSEGGGAPSTGVTNPIYGHLGDLRDQTGGTWGSLAPTPGTEQPTDSLGSLLGAGAPGEALEGSPSHPLLHLSQLGEETAQTQAPEAHHWASLASTHPLHHQTTDLLNNQVRHMPHKVFRAYAKPRYLAYKCFVTSPAGSSRYTCQQLLGQLPQLLSPESAFHGHQEQHQRSPPTLFHLHICPCPQCCIHPPPGKSL